MRFQIPGAIGSLLLLLTPGTSAQAAASSASTGTFPSLTGTWTSKSKQVITGPGFYDPVNEKFFEPSHPGISYSFTDDGWFEEAYYRAVSNPSDPKCPQGIMQWQHGQYKVNATGSIFLTPIESDGRQLTSDPCNYKQAAYERYKQKETFLRYEVVLDKFHNVQRLNLYQFNGVPLMPLYLAYTPPQMLPTMAINPTTTGSKSAASSTATSTSQKVKVKRENIEKRWGGQKMLHYTRDVDAAWFWYAGLGLTTLGMAMYCYNP